MKNITIIRIGGMYQLICAVVHVVMPGMFGWYAILQQLKGHERSLIMQPLYIMNWCMVLLWAVLGILFLKDADEIENTTLGKTILGLMVCFWLIRIFILQPYYIGYADPISWQMVPFFAIGLILNAIPLVRIMRKK